MTEIAYGFLFALIVIGICLILTLFGVLTERLIQKRRRKGK